MFRSLWAGLVGHDGPSVPQPPRPLAVIGAAVPQRRGPGRLPGFRHGPLVRDRLRLGLATRNIQKRDQEIRRVSALAAGSISRQVSEEIFGIHCKAKPPRVAMHTTIFHIR